MWAKRAKAVSRFRCFSILFIFVNFRKNGKLGKFAKSNMTNFFLGIIFDTKIRLSIIIGIQKFKKIKDVLYSMPFANYATTFPLWSRRATSMYLFLPEPAEQSCAAAALKLGTKLWMAVPGSEISWQKILSVWGTNFERNSPWISWKEAKHKKSKQKWGILEYQPFWSGLIIKITTNWPTEVAKMGTKVSLNLGF